MWIETVNDLVKLLSVSSLPLRKCGLKPRWKLTGWNPRWVTSLAEVWIETQLSKCWKQTLASLPLRKCGLKHEKTSKRTIFPGHFPCGSVNWNYQPFPYHRSLNSHFPCGSVDWNVLHTLTLVFSVLRHFPCGSVDWNVKLLIGQKRWMSSLPLRKCGLKLSLACTLCNIVQRHFPCGSVDWNRSMHTIWSGMSGHFPCGSVDWNRDENLQDEILVDVTSLAEVWIETPDLCTKVAATVVTSLAEVWIETFYQ